MHSFIHKLQALAFMAGMILTLVFALWFTGLFFYTFGEGPPMFSGWTWGLTFLGLPIMGALEKTPGVQRLGERGLRFLGVREE